MWTDDTLFMPGPRKPHRARYICCIDRQTCIVIRNKRAVRLGYIQFNIFQQLHEAKKGDKKVMANALFDSIYGGAKNPPNRCTLAAICWLMNKRLRHIGLKVRGVNRRQNSFYQLVVL
jgi:hypothetical protein